MKEKKNLKNTKISREKKDSKKNKIFKKGNFLKALVAMTLLTSMLVCTFLGITDSEYFKTMAKTLDFEVKPDLMLEYYLYDGNTPSSAASDFAAETGSYQSSKGFSQTIRSGKAASDSINNKTYYNASPVVYQIKIPVDETGYYTLDFSTYMTLGTASEENQYINNDTNAHLLILF